MGRTTLDLALLIDADRPIGEDSRGLLRPFADSSLLEIACAKLSRLDAPCARYVMSSDRGIRNLLRHHEGLEPVRPPRSPTSRAITQTWLLVIDAAFPLVPGEIWWSAVDRFLAADSDAGLVAVERVDGAFEGAGGWGDVRSLRRRVPAFTILPRTRFWADGVPLDGSEVFEIPRSIAHEVCDPSSRLVLEAVYPLAPLMRPRRMADGPVDAPAPVR